MYAVFDSFTCSHECAGLFGVELPSLFPEYGVTTEDKRGSLLLYRLYTLGNQILRNVSEPFADLSPGVLAAIETFESFDAHTPESVRSRKQWR